MTGSEQHLDLDALADVLAGEAPPGDGAHVAACARCRADLEELRTAQAEVTARLAALPPVPLPDDLTARLHDALLATTAPDAAGPAGRATTVTPFPSAPTRSPRRWLPAAAAVVVLLAGAGYGLTRLGGSDNAGPTTAGGAKAAAPALDVKRNSTGADYTDRASLAAAVPGLLTGSSAAQDSMRAPAPAAAGPQSGAGVNSQAAPDPLARLRANAGLADCLVALLPPDDPSVQPLAIDYASFRGKPAMVVLLPGAAAGKLDVFVVGPGCSQANDSVLFYTSVDRP